MDARRSYRLSLPGGRVLSLGDRTLVMGILNVSPDSFAEREPLTDPGAALDAAIAMEEAGADLIDIGGESTRPGAEPVPEAEELRRVLPVVRVVAARVRAPVSIDTYKAPVARAALSEGAAMVNDVSGLRYDAALGDVVAAAGAALVLMHTRGRSREMYREAVYADVATEVAGELAWSLERARQAGVDPGRTVLDPGFGFAKRPEHNLRLLASLGALAALDRPLLVGVSRKSFLSRALGDVPAPARDWGTAAAVTTAILGGAHIVRVHAVAEMVQVARVADEIRRHARGDQDPA